MLTHSLSADQLCDALTGERIRNVELGSPLDSDQTTIAIHMSGGRTITISAVALPDIQRHRACPRLKFEMNS